MNENLPFIHLYPPTPPSSCHSFPSPFLFPFSPSPKLTPTLSPHPHAHSFCPAILFASNFQEDLYVVFLVFTLLFGFSRLNDLGLWLESTYESTYHIYLFGSRLSHSVKCFLFLSICMQNSRCHCFLPLSRTLMCICSTSSLFILLLRGI